jgi:hypothetical protein
MRLRLLGHKTDVITLWADELTDALKVVSVDLSTPRDHFRFLTGVKLVINPDNS